MEAGNQLVFEWLKSGQLHLEDETDLGVGVGRDVGNLAVADGLFETKKIKL